MMIVGEIVRAVLIARVIAKNAEFQEEINAAIHTLQAEGTSDDCAVCCK